MLSYAAEVAADSPLGWWRQDDTSGTVLTDSSGNGRNGNYPVAAPTFSQTSLVPSSSNFSSDYNGTTQYSDIATSSVWASASQVSIECWVKFDNAPGGTEVIVSRYSSTAANRFWRIQRQPSGVIELVWVDSAGTQQVLDGATATAAATTYHIVATVDAVGVGTVYVNGVSDGTLDPAGSNGIRTSALNTNIRVGAYNSGAVSLWTNGKIDEVAFYGTALSAARVLTHYEAGIGRIAGGLVTTTSTALAGSVVFAASVAGGLATVTATALAGVALAGAIIAGGTATETDTAEAGAPTTADLVHGGQATETDNGLAGTTNLTYTGGQAFETDTGLAGGRITYVVGGLASETDTTLGGVITQAVHGGAATETDSALAGSNGNVNIFGGLAVETDTALRGTLFLHYVVTETDNRAGGRVRNGIGYATFDPPVVDLPATLFAGVSYPQAQAFGTVTLVGTQPTFTVATARGEQTRTRIMYGNRDITYLRDVPTPPLEKQLIEPFMYGPATLTLPQVNAAFEKLGVGVLSWLRPGRPVREQRVSVATGLVVATTYRGVSTGFDTDGNNLTVAIGGQAAGRMGLRDQQLPLFGGSHDIKQLMNRVFESIRVPFDNSTDDTGIVLDRFGGTGLLDYGQQILARAWTRAGNQWTVMPSADGKYSILRKDTTTVDFTVYLDDARTTLSGHRDISEEPNRIFGRGTTPQGKRVVNGVYPGLIETVAAPYPMDDGSTFGLGTTNGDTDTGDGISVLKARLQTFGLLDREDAEDAEDEYTQDVVDAVAEAQELAGLLPANGLMYEVTWDALYGLDSTGFSVWWSRIVPMAQLRATRPWKRSPDGSIMGKNSDYDPHKIVVDRSIDFGAGFTNRQMREFAHSELDAANDPNWVGEITLGLGAAIRGDHDRGDPLLDADVMPDWEILPGMNVKVIDSAGGELMMHVAGKADGNSPARLSVDTRARDILPLWEVIRRNRESRKDPARRYVNDNRASGETKDVLTEFEEYGGRIEPVRLAGGEWNVFPVVVGKEGEIAKFRLRLDEGFDDTGALVGQPSRFVVAVFGDPISPAKLASMVPDPLTDKAGWLDHDFRQRLDREHRLLYIAGETGDLCGYWPDTQADGGDVTGLWEDDASFHYDTGRLNVARVAVFPQFDCTAYGGANGRIMWNQEIVGS